MLLGLCNVDAKMLDEASPTSTTEDWLWFRLNMVTVRPVDTSQSESEPPSSQFNHPAACRGAMPLNTEHRRITQHPSSCQTANIFGRYIVSLRFRGACRLA